jgi:hypothetical protein
LEKWNLATALGSGRAGKLLGPEPGSRRRVQRALEPRQPGQCFHSWPARRNNQAMITHTAPHNSMIHTKGITRGHGPNIAWFKDPAGNILSVLASR